MAKHLVELTLSRKPHTCSKCEHEIAVGDLYLLEFHNFLFKGSGKSFHRTKFWHPTCFMLAVYDARLDPEFRQRAPRKWNLERQHALDHRNYVIRKLLKTKDPQEMKVLATEVIKLSQELNIDPNRAHRRPDKLRAMLASVFQEAFTT